MKLWLVARDGREVGYDEWDAWIVAHDTGDQAIDSVYHRERGIAVSLVGEALPNTPAGTVILGSFNGG